LLVYSSPLVILYYVVVGDGGIWARFSLLECSLVQQYYYDRRSSVY